MTDLAAMRGDDETYELTILDDDSEPVDLDGCALWFTVKRRHEDIDTDALVRKTIVAGISIVDANAGRADVALTDTETALLPVTVLVWDLQLRDASGRITTIDGGYLTVSADVTRSVT